MSLPQTAWIKPFYPEDAPGVWGARAIFTHGQVDLLPDRQGVVGDDYRTTLKALNAGPLHDASRRAEDLQRDGELQSNSDDVWVLHQADDLVIVASTSRSFGYLYMVAFTPKEN